MNKVKKYKNLLIVFIILASSTFVSSNYISDFVNKSRDSEIVQILNSVAMAQDTYHTSYNEFSRDKEAIGYSPPPGKVFLYFKKEEIPGKYLEKLQSEAIPYASKKSFRVLCITKKMDIWTIDNLKKITYAGKMN